MFTIISVIISLACAQSCCSCAQNDFFQIPSFGLSCPCQTSPCQSFQLPSFSTAPACPAPQPSPCQLPPPPVTEGCRDQLRSHFDSSNRQGCQDSMRANANTCGSNNRADDRCAAQKAKMNFGADVCSNNNRFREVNENEVLCHKKNAREECGDSAARKAAIDLDASNGCRAAQSHRDSCNSQMAAGRDACSRAEDCSQCNADGCRASSQTYQPRGCFF